MVMRDNSKTPALQDLTVGEMLRRTAERFPERPALEYGDLSWDYHAMDGAVDLCARKLLTAGIRKGDRVGLWCEAEPNAIVSMYALVRIGAVCTMLNTSLKCQELRERLDVTEITVLLIGDGYKDVNYPQVCRELDGSCLLLRRILYIGQADCGDFPALDSLEPVSSENLERAAEAVTPEDTAFILYTSGTASLPKAVMGSHYSRANCGIMQAHDLNATEQDRFCVAMPVFHCFCLSVNVMAACAVGACLCLPRSRRTHDLLETVSEKKCTVMSSVPALFHAMLSRKDFEQWDLSSLRTGFIGGSLYPPELFREINDKMGFILLSSLGQAEATAGITTASLEDPLDVRAETVGHFMDHLEGKIADPVTGESLPAGEPGEICVRGYVVMQGYYGLPENTAQVVDQDGWLRTGDMGWLDQTGNLHIAGRLKELIIRGGENISPAEIENVASAWPCVEQCKAVGVSDKHYGEEVCLCVILKEKANWREEDFCAWLKGRLASYKVPRYVLTLDEFPRTVTGKVRPSELRQLAEDCLGLTSCSIEE